MAEETTPDSPKSIKMEATSHDQSKVVQIGYAEAEKFNLTIEQVQNLQIAVAWLESSNRVESSGIVKAGNPHKTLTYWQGRSEEIPQVTQWLEDKNITLIGIEGIGGTGKSMLAAKIYEEIEGFPKRYWADVSSGAVFSDLARRVLTEFGHQVPQQESELVEALVKCLQSGQYLLIVDNLESLLQEDRQWGSQFYSDFFTSWVEYGENSKVLVTTRERPQQPTSSKFQWLSLKGLKIEEGVALLTALGIGGDLEAFTTLADGHPLLLRLVADLLKEEYHRDPSLGRLAELGLENLQQILTDPRVVGQHRREIVGMVLVLDASFARLNNLQKTLLLNVSVYRGTFNKVAGATLLPESSEIDVERELRTLVKRSFLLEKLNSQRWFNFQPVVLEYVRYRAGEQTEVHKRAITYYQSISNAKESWQTIEDIRPQLEIFYHLCELKQYQQANNVLNSCDNFLSLRGYYTAIIELSSRLEKEWQPSNKDENSRFGDVLTSLGSAYHSLGQDKQAIDYYQKSLAIYLEIGDRTGEGGSLSNLGLAYNSLGQHQQAINYLQQALGVLGETGHRNFLATTLANLGYAYSSLGEYKKAIDYNQQSLTICREIGSRGGEASALLHLGNAYGSLGQYKKAIDYYQQSLTIYLEIGHRGGEATSLGNLGNVYNFLGQYQQAIDYYQQSLAIFLEIGNRGGEAGSLNYLGNVYNSLGQYQQAIDYHQESLTIYREIGDQTGEGGSLCNLGSAYYSLRQYQQAIDYYQQALGVLRETGHREFLANSLNNLGDAYGCLGQYQQAIDYYQQSLAIYREIGARLGEAISLGGLGYVYNSLGQYQQAIDYYQQSLAIYREIGDRNSEGTTLGNLGLAYQYLRQSQQAIEFHQQALNIAREIGDRNGEGRALGNIGIAYQSLGQYQQAIEFHQQWLTIAREIGDRNGEGSAWFDLGLSLERINQESDALGAYRNACELAKAMGLDSKVQDCNNAIERLSQQDAPVAPKQGFWGWLSNLW